MSTYNGWTNYATWRINLEIFDGMRLEDFHTNNLDAFSFGQELDEYAYEVVLAGCGNSLAESYAREFMSDVNWTEIASAMIETYKDENIEEDEEERS